MDTINIQLSIFLTIDRSNVNLTYQEDLPLLEAGASQTANVQEYTEIKTKKKGLGVVIAGLGALLLIAIIAAG